VVDEVKAVRTIGPLRRIMGICLLVLGTLVIAQDLWLGASYWSAFGTEERIRFVFWLWAGIVLTVAGLWIAFRIWGTGWLLIFVIVSLAGIAFSYGRWWS
jgi:hypothetical protein